MSMERVRMASTPNRVLFTLLHQTGVLLSSIAAFNISERGDYVFIPFLVSLLPLIYAAYSWYKKAEPVDAKTLRTYLISSLIGFFFALAILAYWLLWAISIVYGGFY